MSISSEKYVDTVRGYVRRGSVEFIPHSTNGRAFYLDAPQLGLCHGCFDVLHPGHVRHLKQAASMCRMLYVSITADEFINKGPDRPIFSHYDRADVLRGIEGVQFVIINHAPDASEVIRYFRPNVLFKGKDTQGCETEGFMKELEALKEIKSEIKYTSTEIFHSTDVAKKILEHD